METTTNNACDFYVDVMKRLADERIPFLIGGGAALTHYVGATRGMKDLDIFMLESDVPAALDFFARLGYDTELTFSHWLGKIKRDGKLVDLIFSSGNSVSRVDELWFQFSVPARVLDVEVRLCPPEEMIWSKAFVQERERFDGADVLHLIRALGQSLDWMRLLTRFGKHWRVLFSHLVLFEFVYPSEHDRVPPWVRRELIRRFQDDPGEQAGRMCQGTLLSRSQYLFDIGQLGYADARVTPEGSMTPEEVEIWTAAADSSAD